MGWGDIASGVGDFLGSPGGGALIGGGMGLIGNYMSSSAQAKGNEASYDAWLKWADMFKPSEEEKMAMRERGAKRIRANYSANKKGLSRTMASRGLGGGQLATAHADNTRALNSELGDLDASIEAIGFGQAPGSPPPAQLGTGTYMMGNTGEMAQYLGGLTMANSLFGSSRSPGTSKWTDSVPGYEMLNF